MTAFRDIRKNFITANADLALVPAGTTVFAKPVESTNGRKKRSLVNVQAGRLAVVNPRTGLAVDDSNVGGLSGQDLEGLIIGVGVDLNGDGMAEVLRRPFGDELFGCTIDYIHGRGPRCGSPHIRDIFFNCIDPCTTYSLKVAVNDSKTRSEEPWNRDPFITISYKTNCGDCDDCSATSGCDELACGLIADWRNNMDDIDWDWKGRSGNDAPVQLVKLFGGDLTSKVYCLTPQDDTCADCAYVDDITEFTFKGVTTQLNNTTNPDDPTQTLVSQLQLVVDQINEVVQATGEGSAVLTRGIGACCEYQLHINTCDAGFELSDGTTPFVPCVNEDPATTNVSDVTCGDCVGATAANGTVTLASAVADDTVTINGLVYTAVAGAKSDNTEFSIDTSDTAAATDLADSINNDTRTGTLFDVSASSALGVVTVTSTVAGTAGNAITLASSNGVRIALSGATLSGGTGGPDSTTYTCGIRGIVDPVLINETCYGPNPLPIYFGRSITFDQVGDNWSPCSIYQLDYQAMELPEGFGAWVHNQEYTSNNGGQGRDFDPFNTHRGPKLLPDARSRMNAVLADPSKSYCLYHIGHKIPHTQYGIDARVNSVPGVTTVAIPEKSTNATASWEAFLAAYVTALGPKCPTVTTVTCASSWSENGERV